MADLLRDVRVAVRRLRAARGFTLFSVLTLAVGIGMTTAIMALIRTTVLRPPHIRDIDRVLNIYHSRGTSGPLMAMSWPDVRDLMAAQTSFESLMAWRRVRVSASWPTTSTTMLGEAVTGNYFDFVGAQPRLGRLLQPADDQRSAPPVVVISEQFWRRALYADPDIVGQVVSLNGATAEIVGVVSSAFQGVDVPNVQPTPLWVPLSFAHRLERATEDRSQNRDLRWLFVKGRLRLEIPIERATAEVATIAQRLDAAFPRGTPEERARYVEYRRDWHVRPADSVYVHESITVVARPAVILTLLMVGLVLLVACTNLANLLLARGAARRGEFAVSLALGASRWRLVREQLVESGVLAAVSGVAAIATARWALVQLTSSSMRMAPGVNLQLTPSADGTVVLAAAMSTGFALVVFGVVPAIRLTRRDLHALLTGNALSGTTRRWRGRAALIAAQVAVSVALMIAAVVCAEQALQSTQHDTGLELDRFAAASIDFRQVGYDETRARETLRRVLASAQRDVSGEGAALASGLPVGLFTRFVAAALPGEPLDYNSGWRRSARLIVATPQLFDVIGVRLTRGRLFRDSDTATAEPVVIISERVAEDLFGSRDAVGQSVSYLPQSGAGEAFPVPSTATIVGVVENSDAGAPRRREEGLFYLPFSQRYETTMAVVVRSSRPADAAAALPELIRRADPNVAVSDVGTGVTLSGIENMPLRIVAALTGLLGGVALILAMSGLYGVLSYLVTGRRREIGVRRAVGATPAMVLRMIITEGLQPVVAGLLTGGAAGWAVWFAAGRLLRTAPNVDPWLIAGVAALFITAGLLACYVPARRAMSLDPSETLRSL